MNRKAVTAHATGFSMGIERRKPPPIGPGPASREVILAGTLEPADDIDESSWV